MKLLQRLRSMGPSIETPAEQSGPEASPVLSQDDYLDPEGPEAFEPMLGIPGAGGASAHGEESRH